jgi:hypothetical protein
MNESPMDAVYYWANENGIAAETEAPPVLDVTAAKRLDELVAHTANDPSELLREPVSLPGRWAAAGRANRHRQKLVVHAGHDSLGDWGASRLKFSRPAR